MPRTINWTESAVFELEEVVNYWNKNNNSNLYSKKLLRLINHLIHTLAEFPYSGPKTTISEIRLKTIKDFVIYYILFVPQAQNLALFIL